MGPLIFFLAAVAPATREATVVPPHTLTVTHTIVETNRVEVPDVIAPAVIPYFRCIAARNSIAFSEKGVSLAPAAQAGADCAGARKAAIAQADALMKAAGGAAETPEARYAQILATLQSVEALVVSRGAATK